MNKITIDELEKAIIASLNNRFTLEREKTIAESLYTRISTSKILRMRRASNHLSSYRTILLCEIGDLSEYDNILTWSYDIRDELMNNESSDLYIFLLVKDLNLNAEECVNIESNEDCCRKYIVRPNESIEFFLSRTFLQQDSNGNSLAGISDPLLVAIKKTATEVSFLTPSLQSKWRDIFLSNDNGQDILDSLLKE